MRVAYKNCEPDQYSIPHQKVLAEHRELTAQIVRCLSNINLIPEAFGGFSVEQIIVDESHNSGIRISNIKTEGQLYKAGASDYSFWVDDNHVACLFNNTNEFGSYDEGMISTLVFRKADIGLDLVDMIKHQTPFGDLSLLIFPSAEKLQEV